MFCTVHNFNKSAEGEFRTMNSFVVSISKIVTPRMQMRENTTALGEALFASPGPSF